ncbi:protein kinase [Histoplasma capsulatum G186AR]|uniref:non-specific serine/threonine protein kinase n=1 Tax=Ajellomyces capsulatus (strain G186AR / H82 / ATCC MYA-2454 / RMSCC 2432) TaxID=447093 RepID=C0NA23_AJECG|nr:protein kinase [Histoplasma capsulatum G186AR]EEH11727.1 protein kinase [Histoplasma capsulatum G186AR]
MASLPSPTREFSTSTFPERSSKELIEEESIPSYKAEQFYPVHIGQVFESRYQVVSKLGFGTSSTVWLCRDLKEHRYLALKVCIRKEGTEQHQHHEITVSQHLHDFRLESRGGEELVRRVLDSFEVTGPNGCTNISSNNLLQGIHDDSILEQLEQEEIDHPSARKSLENGRAIYTSRPMPICTGFPVLCDLGEARIGSGKHRGDIMPGIYRAPEVILGMEWDCKVDIWSIGLMTWDIFEGGRLFIARKDGILDDEQHLAEIVSLLGPPPPEFIRGNSKCLECWDEEGNWKGSIPIPDQSFETREWRLDEEDRALFLKYLRRILRWRPEERPTAEELAFDDFLMQPLVESRARAAGN